MMIRLSIDRFEGDKKQTAEDGTANNSQDPPRKGEARGKIPGTRRPADLDSPRGGIRSPRCIRRRQPVNVPPLQIGKPSRSMTHPCSLSRGSAGDPGHRVSHLNLMNRGKELSP